MSLQVRYPQWESITDPSESVPEPIKTIISKQIEDSEVDYGDLLDSDQFSARRVIEILARCAQNCFAVVAERAFENHPDDLVAFEKAIGFDSGGAAWLGIMAAHFVYKRVVQGRMGFVEQGEVERLVDPHLEKAKREWKRRRKARRDAAQPSLWHLPATEPAHGGGCECGPKSESSATSCATRTERVPGRPESTEPPDLRSAVDAFLARASESAGRKMKKKDFWTVAEYGDATQFQRWVRRDRVTPGSDLKFRNILRMTPEQFLAALAKHKR